jgi:hypothetical protein
MLVRQITSGNVAAPLRSRLGTQVPISRSNSEPRRSRSELATNRIPSRDREGAEHAQHKLDLLLPP